MAPKRKGGARKASAAATKLPTEDLEKEEAPASVEQPVAAAGVDENNAEDEPSPKKTKVEEKKKRGRKPKAASAARTVGAKKKTTDDDEKEDEEEEAAEKEAPHSTVVVIEASKECNCFKTSAAKVESGLITAFPGIEVIINPEKPRKGCFEVRGKEGNVYFSLLGMPRPFTKLKNTDMDKAIEEIVAKVK